MLIPTADLMKKGLRRAVVDPVVRKRVIPTADLMKKGLRRLARVARKGEVHSNRRPDEEGIKTEPTAVIPAVESFQPQT